MEGASLHQVDDLARIRAVILPVGDISTRWFRYYADLVRAMRSVEFKELDRAQLPTSSSGAFTHQRGQWDEGCLRLTYVDANYQGAPWDTFQAHRQALAVFGVCMCPETFDLVQAWESFLQDVQASHEWSGAAAVHCLAFEPSQHHYELMEELGGAVGVSIHYIPGPDPEVVQQQLNVCFNITAHELIHHLEQSIINADQSLKTFVTPNDTDLDQILVKKFRAGRIAKRRADLCLLAGCANDAAHRYVAALELSREKDDKLYTAGALEGLACAAHLLSMGSNGQPVPRSVPITHLRTMRTGDRWDSELPGRGGAAEAHDRLVDAIALFEKRRASALQAAALIRHASSQLMGEGLGKVRWGVRAEVLEVMGRAEACSENLPVQDRIHILGSLATLCARMGCERRLAWVLRKASVCYTINSQWHLAHDTLLTAAKYFQLETRELEPAASIQDILQVPRAGATFKGRSGWFSLQAAVLDDLLVYARHMQDIPRIARYLAYCLPRLCAEPLQGAEGWHVRQRLLAQELGTLSGLYVGPVRANLSIPILHSVHLHALPDTLRTVPASASAKKSGGGKQLFLYCAFDKKVEATEEEAAPMWVQGEVVKCDLVFGNPFTFEVNVEVIGLETEGGGALTLLPLSLKLSARSRETKVTAQIVVGDGPENSVTKVTGCRVRVFNMLSVLPIGGSKDASSWLRKSRKFAHKTTFPLYKSVKELPLLQMDAPQLGGVWLSSEVRHAVVQLTNRGGVAVGYAALEGTPKGVFTFDQDVLKDAVPIAPGEMVQLAVAVLAPETGGACAAELKLEYGSTADAVKRRMCVWKTRLDVVQGLSVVSDLVKRAASTSIGAAAVGAAAVGAAAVGAAAVGAAAVGRDSSKRYQEEVKVGACLDEGKYASLLLEVKNDVNRDFSLSYSVSHELAPMPCVHCSESSDQPTHSMMAPASGRERDRMMDQTFHTCRRASGSRHDEATTDGGPGLIAHNDLLPQPDARQLELTPLQQAHGGDEHVDVARRSDRWLGEGRGGRRQERGRREARRGGSGGEWDGVATEGLEGSCVKRFIFKFRRFTLMQNDAIASVDKTHMPVIGHRAVPYEERLAMAHQEYLDRYKNALFERLSLQWRSTSGSSGTLSLDGIHFTYEDLHRIKPASVTVRVRVHPGGANAAERECSGRVVWVRSMEFYCVSVTVHNLSDTGVRLQSTVAVRAAEGDVFGEAGTPVLVCGAAEHCFQDVAAGACATHTVELCFLQQGAYEIRTGCWSESDPAIASGPVLLPIRCIDSSAVPGT